MSAGPQPNPAQVPTLTEVIELLSPAPVRDDGMGAPRAPAPPAGSPGSEPVVTGGLPREAAKPAWAPMNTVVLPTLDQVPLPLPERIALANLPVLQEAVASEVPPVQDAPAAAPPVPPAVDEAQIVQRVLTDLQKQIDRMIDFRLKEALAPILARHSEAMVRDLKEELARTMGDVVARAVTQEVAKLRQR